MTAPSPSRRGPGVLSGGHLLLLLGALLLLLPAYPAAARGGRGGDRAPPKEKTEEEKILEAIGAEWKAGDADALAARFPEKQKVKLSLPGVDPGEYRAEQALSLLEGYFAARTFSKVELKTVKESTGTFEAEYARDDGKKVKAELLVALGTERKKRVLASARECQ